MVGRPLWERVREDCGYGMLRNKVGIKKMIVANELVSFIPSVECRDPCCSSEYGIQGIRKSSRRSRDPKRRDERIFQGPSLSRVRSLTFGEAVMRTQRLLRNGEYSTLRFETTT